MMKHKQKSPAFHVVYNKLINKTKIGYKIKKQYAFKRAYCTELFYTKTHAKN